MSTIKIIAGDFRGKTIPFSNKKFNDADITSQKIKGAVFSIAGEDMHDRSFLDLYAGSGQMGIEALSRGAEQVILCEIDKERFNFIKSFIKQLDVNEGVLLWNLPAYRLLQYLGKKNIYIDYIYVDPPYNKKDYKPLLYDEILSEIGENNILKENGRIIVQHFSRNLLSKTAGEYTLISCKKYGNTSLSIYSKE